MPLMTGNRNDVVRTKAGHAIAFKAGEDTFVPDINEVVKDCVARGHSLKSASKQAEPKAETPAETSPVEKKTAAK